MSCCNFSDLKMQKPRLHTPAQHCKERQKRGEACCFTVIEVNKLPVLNGDVLLLPDKAFLVEILRQMFHVAVLKNNTRIVSLTWKHVLQKFGCAKGHAPCTCLTNLVSASYLVEQMDVFLHNANSMKSSIGSTNFSRSPQLAQIWREESLVGGFMRSKDYRNSCEEREHCKWMLEN